MNISRGLSFVSAFALVQRGMKSYRAAWGEAGETHIMLTPDRVVVKVSGESTEEWVPTQEDMMSDDWHGLPSEA